MIIRPIIRGILSSGGGDPEPPVGPLPNGSITVASRGSVYLGGAGDYYTMADSASLDFADSASNDWALVSLIRPTLLSAALPQYIYNHGSTGGVQNAQLYLNNNVVTGIARSSGSAVTAVQSGTLTGGGAAAWVYVSFQCRAGNLEVMVCPVDGAATVGTGVAAPAGVITPTGLAYIGARSDLNSTRFFANPISLFAKLNQSLTTAQLESLAAGADFSDLSITPAVYIRLDADAATITDSSGNGNTATRVGAPKTRGGPRWAGRAFAIDTLGGRLDGFWDWVWQRDPNSASIAFSGTYNGSPTGVEARVINDTNAQHVAWTPCATPSAGVWNVTLDVPTGPELVLEVRDTADPTQFQRTVLPWGVGDIFGLSGESLGAQAVDGSTFNDTASTDYPGNVFAPSRQRVSIFRPAQAWLNGAGYSSTTGGGARALDIDNGKFYRCLVTNTAPGSGTFADYRAANPTHWSEVDLSDANLQVDMIAGTSGAFMHVIDRIQKYRNVPCMGVSLATSGTALAGGNQSWGSPTTTTQRRFAAIMPYLGNKLAALAFPQGANDANASDAPTTAQYYSAFETLKGQLQGYVSGTPNIPICLPVSGRNFFSNSQIDEGFQNVRAAHRQLAADFADIYPGGEVWAREYGDALHPSAAGYVRMYKCMAQAILNHLEPGTFTNGVIGPSLSSAAINGTDIDLTWTLNDTGATTLQGETGASGLTGFLVYGASVSVTSASKTTVSISAMTRSGTVATVTATGHGLSVGDSVWIVGSNVDDYNGPKVVATVPDANTFTFAIVSTATTPTTGTRTLTYATATITGHGLTTGDSIGYFGATTRHYNTTSMPVRVVDANTIRYAVHLNADTNAAGTMVMRPVVPITTTAIPSATVVRLTPSIAPVSGWQVAYVPGQNAAITNPLYNNASVVGSTLGVPAQTFAPVTFA